MRALGRGGRRRAKALSDPFGATSPGGRGKMAPAPHANPPWASNQRLRPSRDGVFRLRASMAFILGRKAA